MKYTEKINFLKYYLSLKQLWFVKQHWSVKQPNSHVIGVPKKGRGTEKYLKQEWLKNVQLW